MKHGHCTIEMHCGKSISSSSLAFKMASFRRLVKLPVNQLVSRQFSVSSRAAAYLRLDPAPYEREVADAGLAAVIQKEKGSWKDLTKEEKLQRKFVRPVL